MARFDTNLFKDIKKVVTYAKNNPEVKLPGVEVTVFESLINEINDQINELVKLNQKIKETQKSRDENFTKAKDLAVRYKKMVAALYGSDSKEIKEIGLKPSSERKSPLRKKKA